MNFRMSGLSAYLVVVLILFHRSFAKDNCESNSDDTSTNDPLELQQLYPYYVAGFDYDNLPVVVIECGKWDHLFVSQNMERYGNEMKKFKQDFFGCLDNLSNATFTSPEGEEFSTDEFGLILDFDGFNLKHLKSSASASLMLEFWKGFKRFDNDIAYGFYINVNAIAENFILLSKPLLSKAFERSELYGTRKQAWIPALQRKMSKSILPPSYGGDNECYNAKLGCLI